MKNTYRRPAVKMVTLGPDAAFAALVLSAATEQLGGGLMNNIVDPEVEDEIDW